MTVGCNNGVSIRQSLRDDGSDVIVDGVGLGKDWLRVSRDKDVKASIVSREHEMRRLKS